MHTICKQTKVFVSILYVQQQQQKSLFYLRGQDAVPDHPSGDYFFHFYTNQIDFHILFTRL
jgi:hypothetical protein